MKQRSLDSSVVDGIFSQDSNIGKFSFLTCVVVPIRVDSGSYILPSLHFSPRMNVIHLPSKRLKYIDSIPLQSKHIPKSDGKMFDLEPFPLHILYVGVTFRTEHSSVLRWALT